MENNVLIKRNQNQINLLRDAEEINLALYNQDELDRAQTQLYGFNEEFCNSHRNTAESPVTINKNCIQCSGNAQFIKKAFKMACLNYNSSQVTHKNVSYARPALFKKRQEILAQIEEMNVSMQSV